MAKKDLPLKGLEFEIRKETLVIFSDVPLKTLGSSIVGGGFNKTRYIINHQVEKNFSHNRPEQYLLKVARGLEIFEPFAGMMTAADLKNLSIKDLGDENIMVVSLVTGGISNAAAAGEANPGHRGTGTINTIILTNARLSSAAMTGAIITATEAKTAALRELGIRSVSNNEIATGTTTDSTIIATTRDGIALKYSGTATILGELIGKTAKKATLEAVKKQEGYI